jgi:hypothetical protein
MANTSAQVSFKKPQLRALGDLGGKRVMQLGPWHFWRLPSLRTSPCNTTTLPAMSEFDSMHCYRDYVCFDTAYLLHAGCAFFAMLILS